MRKWVPGVGKSSARRLGAVFVAALALLAGACGAPPEGVGAAAPGGLRRLDCSLDGDVRVLLDELGGNDGLRGLPPEELKKNLTAIVHAARERHVRVVLCGMEAPPNAGPAYATAFREAFSRVARDEHVPFVRFVLDKVAGIEGLNQQDGIHPNARGARLVADTVWPALQPLLDPVSRS